MRVEYSSAVLLWPWLGAANGQAQGKNAKGLISFYALMSKVPWELLLIAAEWNPIAGYEPRKKPINGG